MTAKTTVSSILDTLSNNDFVTLLKYNNETTELVPCFKDMLIQATPENLDTFKKSMDDIVTDGVANLTAAFTKAFSLLKTYREIRDCNADSPCNQLIMLITDGIPGGKLGNNLKEVVTLLLIISQINFYFCLIKFSHGNEIIKESA